jgi:hypothetical protein
MFFVEIKITIVRMRGIFDKRLRSTEDCNARRKRRRRRNKLTNS